MPVPGGAQDIFYASTGSVLLAGPTAVTLYDLQQQSTIAEVQGAPVKYASWSADGNMVALMSKHSEYLHA